MLLITASALPSYPPQLERRSFGAPIKVLHSFPRMSGTRRLEQRRVVLWGVETETGLPASVVG